MSQNWQLCINVCHYHRSELKCDIALDSDMQTCVQRRQKQIKGNEQISRIRGQLQRLSEDIG